MIYIFLGSIISIFVFLEIFVKNKKLFIIVFYIILLSMIFLVGFRNGLVVGTDSPVYYDFYIEKYPEVEIGYKYINAFFSSMGLSYNFFLLCINSIALYSISKFIKLNSYYLLLPLLIYYSDFFFYYNFSGIRQAIAISFTSLSVYYIFNKKNKIALFLILFGSFFHVTAIIFLLCLIVPREKLGFKQYFYFLFFVSLGALVGSYIVNLIPYLNSKFVYYSEFQQQSENVLSNYTLGVFKRSIIFFCVLLVYKNFFNSEKNFYIFNVYLVGFIIYVFTYLVSPEFGVRLGTYFIVMDCILASSLISSSKSMFNKFFIAFVFVLIALYKIYSYSQIESYSYEFLIL